jgi:S1-C subfamily serine protease
LARRLSETTFGLPLFSRKSERSPLPVPILGPHRPVSVGGTGARVVDVVADTPADGVLQPGDVIVAVDGAPVTTAHDLSTALESAPPGRESAAV